MIITKSIVSAGSLWVKDTSLQANLNYEIANVLNEQNKREAANGYFEKAIKLAKSTDPSLSAKYSAIFSSKLTSQAENEKDENPALALGLLRKAAEQRITTSEILSNKSLLSLRICLAFL